jgi:hypothetical protein
MNKLFIVLLGGKPADSIIEAHNVYCGVASNIGELCTENSPIKRFWPSAPKIHIDAYMCVEQVGEYLLTLREKGEAEQSNDSLRLFFINLGGYREGVFDEVHKRLLIVAVDEADAVRQAKTDSFFSEGVREGRAVPHIDDKLDVNGMLQEDQDDMPIDVGEIIENQGYVLSISKAESGISSYPEIVHTGFYRIL